MIAPEGMDNFENVTVYIAHPAHNRYFEVKHPKAILNLAGNMVNVIAQSGASYMVHETNMLIYTKPTEKEVCDANGNS